MPRQSNPAPFAPAPARRTPDEVRAELQRQGVSITQWAIANKFSPNLVFEVLGGRKKGARGQAHDIAVKLGLLALLYVLFFSPSQRPEIDAEAMGRRLDSAPR